MYKYSKSAIKILECKRYVMARVKLPVCVLINNYVRSTISNVSDLFRLSFMLLKSRENP